ncbi:MAG: hypothetical protein HY056_12490 [Proteobacteria bacterium]|nr:hypothetical protein [Pseudomonadota bacterium]
MAMIDAPTPTLSAAELDRMAQAAVMAVDCIKELAERGSNLVAEVLRDGGEFVELEHYPPDDVYDPATHAQYYFHAHPAQEREHADYGHFHTFLRPRGMPADIRPAAVPNAPAPADDNAALSHLVAISINREGLPVRLFATNRWVTAETWYAASDVVAMLDRFAVTIDQPSAPLNRWLTSMFVLFRPQIESILFARDRAVAQWHGAHPDIDVFEDRRLEVAAAIDISLHDQISWLDAMIDAGGEGAGA